MALTGQEAAIDCIMITVLTQFPLPSGIDLDDFRKSLAQTAPVFQQSPGLHAKYFLIAEDGRSAGGVYLWRFKSDALAFESNIRDMIRTRLGVEATITYFETPVIVDNLTGSINYQIHFMPVRQAKPDATPLSASPLC